MTNVIIGEFVGTILLVLLGDGVCANVTLNNSTGFFCNGSNRIRKIINTDAC